MELAERATAHAALGDVKRLLIVDSLAHSDRTVAELAASSGMGGNLLAHHLDVLETAGLIERRVSEGDRRRKYVTLRWGRLPPGVKSNHHSVADVAFVCTHNSARSQFAAALWEQHTGHPAQSAGSDPSPEVHPQAVSVAADFGIDLSDARPGGYERLPSQAGLIVSVCDRAHEAGLPPAAEYLHWSVPDPVVTGRMTAFQTAFAEIAERIAHFAEDAESSR